MSDRTPDPTITVRMRKALPYVPRSGTHAMTAPDLPPLPEPYTVLGRFVDEDQRTPVYTADQLRTYGDDREAEGRRKGLEEAAKAIQACRPAKPDCVWEAAYQAVADDHIAAIRSLAGKEGS